MKNLLTCEWRKLAFANYIVPPEILEKYLPAHTQLDYFNGNCIVSLVGFQFKNISVAGIKVPFYSDFEEINLRFYVKRFDGAKWRKGIVFISEIANKKALGLLANTLAREHYQILPTTQEIRETEDRLDVNYSWKFRKKEQFLRVISSKLITPYEQHSESDFILDRLYGYGQIDEEVSNEYSISHNRWQTYEVREYSIDVDFMRQFGPEFSILTSMTPHSVMLAEGSKVQVNGIQKIHS
ncbi:hypothetical protein SAMN04488034_10628 [Salinimicrobium catena]|uniref:DUF2071 domain-containing protein n=1 Tax=Salinimicrobium catena TaxID=390640 RepID=A0A1H5NX66_9FLAO|nr:DUF2071 domain-containing protein [Salinimicrobium catena]SDL60912.1 hypothetical protein SAMN04488140_10686 [Salinimicrobium catena]SEF05387.1 hypothetical protein SAMN04488034_10628 [Salinimicrobium catena]